MALLDKEDERAYWVVFFLGAIKKRSIVLRVYREEDERIDFENKAWLQIRMWGGREVSKGFI